MAKEVRRGMQAFKAEIVLGLLLAVRHRAVRLALGLTVLTIVAHSGGDPDAALVWVLAGSVAAVAASRIVAPGPALVSVADFSSAGRAGTGRLIGVGVLLVPVAGIVAGASAGGNLGLGLQFWLAGAGYGLWLATAVAAAAPWTGATTAGTLGVFCAWIGQAAPDVLFTGAGAISPAKKVLEAVWVVAPMSWRVQPGRVDASAAAALLLWICAGAGAVCISLGIRLRAGRRTW